MPVVRTAENVTRHLYGAVPTMAGQIRTCFRGLPVLIRPDFRRGSAEAEIRQIHRLSRKDLVSCSARCSPSPCNRASRPPPRPSSRSSRGAGRRKKRARCRFAFTVIRCVPTTCCSSSTSPTRRPTTHTPVRTHIANSSQDVSAHLSRSSSKSTTSYSSASDRVAEHAKTCLCVAVLRRRDTRTTCNGRSVARVQFSESVTEEAALGVGLREVERALVSVLGVVMTTGAPKQFRIRRMEVAVVVQFEGVQEGKPRLGSVDFGDCDGSVHFDDR